MSSHSAINQLIQSHMEREAALNAAVTILRKGQMDCVGGFGITSGL